MSAFMLYRRCLPALAVALAMALTGCSHGSSSATRSTPSAAPVYPGARVGPWGNAYSTSDSFDTVYSYYEKNLPAGSERSHITGPQQTAIFLIGSGNDRLSVTVAASPLCCRTLIVIARARA